MTYTEFWTRFRLIELTLGRLSTITRWFGANTFQVNLCTAVERTSLMDSGLWGSFSSMYSLLLCWWFTGWNGFWARFCVLIFYAPATAVVSSRTLSFCFASIAFSLSSFNTALTPAIRNHCTCFNSLISGVKVSNLSFWSVLIFSIVFTFWLSGVDVFWRISVSYNSHTVWNSQLVHTVQDVIKWDLFYRVLEHHHCEE